MKTPSIKLLLFPVILAMTAPAPAQTSGTGQADKSVFATVHLKGVNESDSKFVNSLAAVEKLKLEEEQDSFTQFHIIQRVGDGHYIATLYPDGETNYAVIIPGSAFADGENIRVRVAENGVYSYKTVLGAIRTIKGYKAVTKEHKPMTAQELKEQLEAGAEFLVKSGTITSQCKRCTGSGKEYKASGYDHKGPCSKCDGKGKIEVPKVIKVIW